MIGLSRCCYLETRSRQQKSRIRASARWWSSCSSSCEEGTSAKQAQWLPRDNSCSGPTQKADLLLQVARFRHRAQPKLVDHGLEQGIQGTGGFPDRESQAGPQLTQLLHKQVASARRPQEPVGRLGGRSIQRGNVEVLSQALTPSRGPKRFLVSGSHSLLLCVIGQTKFAQEDLMSRPRVHFSSTAARPAGRWQAQCIR